MRLKYALTGMLLMMTISAECHPLHLTFTNLEYQSRKNRWTLVIKVFSDDFATNLQMNIGAGIVIDQHSKGPDTDAMLKKWLDKRLMIWLDEKNIDLNTWKLEDIEVKKDATWITYHFSAPKPSTDVKIMNTLLFDLYPDQKNLFILAMGPFQTACEFKINYQETVIKLNK